MATTPVNTECAVCCEVFNKTTHIKISCEHSGVCSYDACKTCVKTYLFGTTSDPNCMKCNKGWSDKFLAKNLGSSFLRVEYSTHRKELLVQHEISRLPESMAAAETRKQIFLLDAQITELTNQTKLLCTFLNKQFSHRPRLQSLYYELAQKPNQDVTTLKSLQGDKATDIKYVKDLKSIIQTKSLLTTNIQRIKHNIAVIRTGGTIDSEDEAKSKVRKFIMPCTNKDCRGYLSSNYKCELCEHHTCSKCFELIGLMKNEDKPHACKPENVESAEFVRKQTKPCPSCGSRISKIDGCDQMWCTAPKCQTAFSWNTGKIVTGVIHNPHYYQFQREHGGGQAPRNPGDVVCGGLPHPREILGKISRVGITKLDQTLSDALLNIHRLQGHFTQLNVTPLRRAVRDVQNNEHERVDYILKKISREELATKVLRNDNDRKKKTALLHVCELFIDVGNDMFRKIVASDKTTVEFYEELIERMREYDTLRQYCNEQFKEISMLYNVCVPCISAEWTVDSTKFTSKGDVSKYIEVRTAKRIVRKEKNDKRLELDRALLAERNARYQTIQLENDARVQAVART